MEEWFQGPPHPRPKSADVQVPYIRSSMVSSLFLHSWIQRADYGYLANPLIKVFPS